MKKIAVILSGCGVFDGAEIHEAVLSMLAIQKNGAEYQLFAPDIFQYHVINHITGEEMDEKRNVLTESARIARGNIKNLKEYKAVDYDAILLPGGYGVAKNLCNFAFKGSSMEINEEISKALLETHKQGKPVGAMCISPVILAKLLPACELTIGNDEGTANLINEMGATHVQAEFTEVIADKKNKVFTTPCYMLNSSITQIATGTENLILEILKAM